MVSQTRLLLIYSSFLLVSGLIGFALAGFKGKAKSSIIMGVATAVLMLVGAYAYHPSSPSILRRSASSLVPLLVFLFACIFAWRAHLIWNVQEKQWLVLLLAIMSIFSWFVFVGVLSNAAKENDKRRLDAAKEK